jgi:glycosyltransferase involved in cell wall biosynthesis
MIVRDEAPVIGRCLDSVRDFVDRWVIVDTGSTDGTQAHVLRHLDGLRGTLHERPWRDFAYNRNEALSLARDSADYVFFIDADETLCLPRSWQRPALTADGYHLRCDYAGTTYMRCALVATRVPWRWRGVVHECLETDAPHALRTLEGPSILVRHDGARSRQPDTYAKDAELLQAALDANPADTRAAFYLAQSLRDAGDLHASVAAYRTRAGMGGWDEEVWYSLYQIARLRERLDAPATEVSQAYLAAYAFRPIRAEPLVELARFHRLRGEFPLAHLYAARAAMIPRPADLLFLDDDAYRWRALDELAIAAFYVGQHVEGRTAMLELWRSGRFPASEQERLRRNCGYYGIATS